MIYKMALSINMGLLLTFFINVDSSTDLLPVVINTWAFTNATQSAWQVLQSGGSVLDAVVAGCGQCEVDQCDGTVGYGGSPDESGETTLDAMIMDGQTLSVGAVSALKRVKNAIGVARAVMDYTTHTLLAGESATQFAIGMGFKEEDLHTNKSINIWKQWKNNHCQPNYRKNVSPNPRKSCGPYKRNKVIQNDRIPSSRDIGRFNHDTIGMVVVDKNRKVVSGTSTNGMNHKVPGRVGDSPIAGAGSYADSDVGGAAATGDGDVMMRLLPSYQAVEFMRNGDSPSLAAAKSIQRIIHHYPNFSGALIAVTKDGQVGAACNGIPAFPYSVINPKLQKVTVVSVKCI